MEISKRQLEALEVISSLAHEIVNSLDEDEDLALETVDSLIDEIKKGLNHN